VAKATLPCALKMRKGVTCYLAGHVYIYVFLYTICGLCLLSSRVR
jgi:hypothetical protein